MTQQVQVANHEISEPLGWSSLAAGAVACAIAVHMYDCGGSDQQLACRTIDLEAFGRLVFTGIVIRASDAAAFLDAISSAPWGAVPEAITLIEADPHAVGRGHYDAAEALHRHFLAALSRDSAAVVAALLHLTRPGLYPVLDLPIRRLYDEPAQRAWEASDRSARPRSRRSYWPVIRSDVLAAQQPIHAWRRRLAASESAEERRVATLSDVRLWEIMARGLGRESPAHS